jgi:hypothetical protein
VKWICVQRACIYRSYHWKEKKKKKKKEKRKLVKKKKES